MFQRLRPGGTLDGPSSVREPSGRCTILRAAVIAVPLPWLVVARAPASAGPPRVLVGVAVLVAALIAAAAARWCSERRMRSEVELHERELAHTKRQILGLVSHELRTPVTGVIGFSRTLAGRFDELDHGSLRLFVEAIDEHANRLARLIDNVVVASRTPLVITDGTCQLSQVLSRAGARVGIGRAGSRLHVSLEGALGARIDEEAAVRIMANLIDNALKFGDPGGGIYVDGTERDGRVVVRVSNSGPAIPLGLRAALYDPFVQGDTTDTRTADGLGLGLHVCRQLIEAYGGTIDLVDHPELIVFEISLPVAYHARPEVPPASGDVAGPDRRPDPVPEAPATMSTMHGRHAPTIPERAAVEQSREQVG